MRRLHAADALGLTRRASAAHSRAVTGVFEGMLETLAAVVERGC